MYCSIFGRNLSVLWFILQVNDVKYLEKALDKIRTSNDLWVSYVEDLFSEKLKEFSTVNVQMLILHFLKSADGKIILHTSYVLTYTLIMSFLTYVLCV